jgi:hypothetical protein
MRGRKPSYGVGTPITLKGRMIISGCLLLVAIILGFAASIALYQFNRDFFRSSDAVGYVLCGPRQHIDDVPSPPHSRRMICRNDDGIEVSARNNLIAVNMALPFIVLFSIPFQMLAWRVAWREVRR